MPGSNYISGQGVHLMLRAIASQECVHGCQAVFSCSQLCSAAFSCSQLLPVYTQMEVPAAFKHSISHGELNLLSLNSRHIPRLLPRSKTQLVGAQLSWSSVMWRRASPEFGNSVEAAGGCVNVDLHVLYL